MRLIRCAFYPVVVAGWRAADAPPGAGADVGAHPTGLAVAASLLAGMIALLAGFGMSGAKRRSWIRIAGFALIISGAVHVIYDQEHPRAGLIRVGSADRVLVDLRRDREP